MTTMMDVLKEKFGVTSKRGDYGVEIEVEGDNLPRDVKGWRAEHDGSLRGNSCEYVMADPRVLSGTILSLKTLSYAYKANETKVQQSNRTGVHVHVNIQRLTYKELFTFITTYLVLEDLLVSWCGESRVGNLFCLRTRDADYFYQMLEKAVQTRNIRYLVDDDIRYCSINLAAIGKYGSVEFRSMRGTDNLKDVITWVKLLDKVKTNSVTKFKDPRTVIEAMSVSTPKEFIETIFEELSGEILALPDTDLSLWDGVRRAQDVAFLGDWGKKEGSRFRKPTGVVGNWAEEW